MPLQLIPDRAARRFLVAQAVFGSCVAIALAAPASGETLTSTSFRIVGAHLNGGGAVDLQAAAPEALVARAGASIGQSPPLGSSADMSAGPMIHSPGFWPIVAGLGGAVLLPTAVPASTGLARWLLACSLALAALPSLRRSAKPARRSRGQSFLRRIFTARARRQR